ncbi:MAG: hypothetical protein EOR26_32505 [Mesorhizobium sp.]|nr:MAG: hypothetical protein EOQ70_32405 [Mesorhizobium sp.]RWI40292.1 MAG: hypothetical protein EOR15_33000 [Mesorhizobium sp.]RWJ19071.1 MAG: hypothetical protein EOR26_32505 [Mesorhizobium sp.]RWJ81942.1 MAG: hypothetical protein EOR37_32385 [Mesorhizobium sp.]RWK14110.1 MAG: hypothetical protein EOR41_29110 [Mesorhizobium sp.]
MVGPAAKRGAVAHLQAVMGLSERRGPVADHLRTGADVGWARRPPETELRGRLRELDNGESVKKFDPQSHSAARLRRRPPCERMAR